MIVVTISQCICMSSHHIVHYIVHIYQVHATFVNCTSIKPEKGKSVSKISTAPSSASQNNIAQFGEN